MWDAGFEGMNPEADDYLHNPDPKRDRKVSSSCSTFLALRVSLLFPSLSRDSSTRPMLLQMLTIVGNRNNLHMAWFNQYRLPPYPTPRRLVSVCRIPNHILLHRKLAQDGRSIQSRWNQRDWSSPFNSKLSNFDRYRYAG